MSGSFWKFSNGYTSLSNVLTLLEQYTSAKNELSDDDEALEDSENSIESVLEKLLDENDLLQELLSNNSMLLEFLRDDQVLSLLVALVVNEGKAKEEEDKQENEEGKETDDKDVENEEAVGEENKKDHEEEEEDSADNNDEKDKHQVKEDDENDIGEEIDSVEDSFDNQSVEEDSADDSETEAEKQTRQATLAAEILSADVWSLTDTVMESTANLNTLWAVLDSPSPLSINLSTYFMKIMEHLLDMKCDEMITYLIDNQPRLVAKFMNHLSNPPLMDFLLKLISTDKPDNSTGIIDFLQKQGLIGKLISSLDVSYIPTNDEVDNLPEAVEINGVTEPEALLMRQSSAADFLKALITISANSTTDNSSIGPNELTRELVSHEQMLKLCNIMLKGDYALANGVGIIIEIIRKNNSDYDLLPVLYITLESHPPTGRDPIYLGHLLKVFGENIDKFNQLLLKSPSSKSNDSLLIDQLKNGKLKTPFGEIEPLGFERFKICELIAELLHCSNMALLNDNKGFNIVKERDQLRENMKEYDPISFKYNEVIVLPNEWEAERAIPSEKNETDQNDDDNDDLTKVDNDVHELDRSIQALQVEDDMVEKVEDVADEANYDDDESEDPHKDTVDSFNSKDTSFQSQLQEDEEETHANANLTEAQIRAKPVIGDFLKISLYDTQIVSNILTMFFKFPWNNFLHNVVFDIVQQVLNGSMDIGFNKFLAMDLFDRGDITSKIIRGQKECTQYEVSHNGLRLGYMGHLTLIAEEVVKFIQLYPANSLSELIDVKVEDEVWEDYVSHVLFDTREKYNAILGGGEDDEDESASNTFDEGVGEILEDEDDEGHKGVAMETNGLVFDSEVDHDIIGSGYEEYDGKTSNARDTVSSSDESESEEDDDHFSNYMSLQLTTAETNLPSPTTKLSDEEEEESSEEENDVIRGPSPVSVASASSFDDDYIDPNDDGLSYKKAHPLYDTQGSLIGGPDDDELSEDSSSSSDEELIDTIADNANEKDTGNKLTRAASKS